MRRITALTAVPVVAAALLVAPAASAATATCTAYASMPTRIALQGKKVVLHAMLRGTPGCHASTDNGASADLHAPGTTTESLRWRTFGATQAVELYASLAKTGTYRVTTGDVQLYDSASRRVDWSWRNTSTVVKWDARAEKVTASGGHVTGHTVRSSKYGLVVSRTTVSVQRRVVGTDTWRTIGSATPTAKGNVSYATGTSPHYAFRLAFPSTATTWGAVSAQVRG